jgi:hypothetical protein
MYVTPLSSSLSPYVLGLGPFALLAAIQERTLFSSLHLLLSSAHFFSAFNITHSVTLYEIISEGDHVVWLVIVPIVYLKKQVTVTVSCGLNFDFFCLCT